jgi:gluconate 2-dehydrogenase gamma chain
MDRRTFLLRTGGGLMVASAPFTAFLGGNVVRAATGPGGFAQLSTSVAETLGAVLEHLLPSEPAAPGAREIHATAYLRFVLSDPTLDPEQGTFLLRGIENLERLARAQAARRFVELSAAQREAVLRAFEASAEGSRWLGEMLDYLMEALLGDPVYGGNPDGVGWRWLHHTPGFPRPPAGKRYFLL